MQVTMESSNDGRQSFLMSPSVSQELALLTGVYSVMFKKSTFIKIARHLKPKEYWITLKSK